MTKFGDDWGHPRHGRQKHTVHTDPRALYLERYHLTLIITVYNTLRLLETDQFETHCRHTVLFLAADNERQFRTVRNCVKCAMRRLKNECLLVRSLFARLNCAVCA